MQNQNINVNVNKPPDARDGDMYYDTDIAVMKLFFEDTWHTIGINYPSDINYVWVKHTDLPYLKILNVKWLMANITEIIQWLHDEEAGQYVPELASIMFRTDQAATFFELKWR